MTEYFKLDQESLLNHPKLEDKELAERNAVFLCFYADDAKPYRDSENEYKDIVIPQVLMSFRWDGVLGFIGGNVDEGESLIEALSREVKEEIAFDIVPSILEESATFICTHKIRDGFNSHLYAMKISQDMLYALRDHASVATHHDEESAGMITPHLNSKTLAVISRKGALAPTVHEEFHELFSRVFKASE